MAIGTILTKSIIVLLTMSSTTESFVASNPNPSLPLSDMPSQQNEPHGPVDGKQEILQLAPADPNSDIPKLQFGQAMKLDVLGPIIINTDGTTRRIDNWDTLTEKEKEVTWRRIRKRNAERRELLEAKYKEMSQLESEQNDQEGEDE